MWNVVCFAKWSRNQLWHRFQESLFPVVAAVKLRQWSHCQTLKTLFSVLVWSTVARNSMWDPRHRWEDWGTASIWLFLSFSSGLTWEAWWCYNCPSQKWQQRRSQVGACVPLDTVLQMKWLLRVMVSLRASTQFTPATSNAHAPLRDEEPNGRKLAHTIRWHFVLKPIFA